MNSILICGLLIALASTKAFWFQMRYARRLKPLFKRLAAKRCGRVMSRGRFTPPHLVLTAAGVELRISATAGGISDKESRDMTLAEIAVSENAVPTASLQERGTKLVNSIAEKLPRGRDILMGNSRFDMRFRVSGPDPERIRAFFAKDEIALRLLKLPDGVELDCSKGRCVLAIPGVAWEEHALDHLIEAAAEIARWAVRSELPSSSPNDRPP